MYHLTRKKDMEDIKLISDALFAIGKLNLKDPELLETLCSNGVKAFEDIKPNDPVNAVVRSILTSLGQLNYFHEGILDCITKWYTSRLDQGQSRIGYEVPTILWGLVRMGKIGASAPSEI